MTIAPTPVNFAAWSLYGHLMPTPAMSIRAYVKSGGRSMVADAIREAERRVQA